MDLRTTSILLLFLPILRFFSADNDGCCAGAGQTPPPPPYILGLQPFNENQTLALSWLANHSVSQQEGEKYEIQVEVVDVLQSADLEVRNDVSLRQTSPKTKLLQYNVSMGPVGGDGGGGGLRRVWEWTSLLPLECANHSVRIRHFYDGDDDSVIPSSWSRWWTNYALHREPAPRIRMFPTKVVMLEGSQPMLCCVPPAGASITDMRLLNVPYRLISLGDGVMAIDAGKLTIPQETFKRLWFYCEDSTSANNNSYIYPSIPPEMPRNVTCDTSDLRTLTCRWDPGKDDYLLADHNKRTQTLSIDLQPGARHTCKKSSCAFPVVRGLEEYHVSLVVSNPLGRQHARHSFNISERVFPVAKWCRVHPGVTEAGVMEANVSWTTEECLSPLAFLCQVSLNDRITAQRCESAGGLCQANVRGLLPNTLYSARVRCGLQGKAPGGWTHPTRFRTHLLVTVDLWRKINQFSNNIRNVTLIWNWHVPGSAREAVNVGFEIQWSQEGENHTSRADKGQSQAEISIGGGRCDVMVQATVEKGFSFPVFITIPPVDAGGSGLKPSNWSGSGPVRTLSWTGEDSATCGYTVEWCILGNATCALRWMKLPRGNTSLLLSPRDSEDGNRYTFNIYGCTESGHKLLETQTGYFLELEPVTRPMLIATSTSSSVTLEWQYSEDDPTHPGFIIGYLVTWQEVAASQGSAGQITSNGELFKMSVMDRRRKWVTVEGLAEDRMYRFSLSAQTKAGSGPVTTTTIGTRRNLLVYWVKILVPLAILLGCGILLYHRRMILKSWLTITFAFPDVTIKTFEFERFLQETSSKLDPQDLDECVCCEVEIINTKWPPQ